MSTGSFLHALVANQCQQHVCTHTFLFIPTGCYLIIPNTCITFEGLFVPFTNSKPKTFNNVSEFTHLNWIIPSYYSSPKHKKSASEISDTLLSLLYPAPYSVP